MTMTKLKTAKPITSLDDLVKMPTIPTKLNKLSSKKGAGIRRPGRNDVVICQGQVRDCDAFPNNRHFKDLIQENLRDYMSHDQRTAAIARILDIVRGNGGRFLILQKNGSVEEASGAIARQFVRGAFAGEAKRAVEGGPEVTAAAVPQIPRPPVHALPPQPVASLHHQVVSPVVPVHQSLVTMMSPQGLPGPPLAVASPSPVASANSARVAANPALAGQLQAMEQLRAVERMRVAEQEQQIKTMEQLRAVEELMAVEKLIAAERAEQMRRVEELRAIQQIRAVQQAQHLRAAELEQQRQRVLAQQQAVAASLEAVQQQEKKRPVTLVSPGGTTAPNAIPPAVSTTISDEASHRSCMSLSGSSEVAEPEASSVIMDDETTTAHSVAVESNGPAIVTPIAPAGKPKLKAKLSAKKGNPLDLLSSVASSLPLTD